MRFSSSKGAPRPRYAIAARTLAAAILSAVPAAFQSTTACAQTWDGGASNDNWSAASNWNPDAVPANTGAADLTFAGDLRTSPDLDLDFAANSLRFASTSPFTLVSSGSHVLTLGAGGITSDASSASMRITAPLALGAATIPINVAQGTAPGGLDLELFGPIGQSAGVIGSIVKSGAGTLRLTNTVASSYTGSVTVNEGTLQLASPATDGAIRGDLTIGDGVGGQSADVVRVLISNQIDQSPGHTVTINNTGLLDLNTHDETLYNLVDKGRLEMTNAATLQVNGTATVNGVIQTQSYCNLRFLGPVTMSGIVGPGTHGTLYAASTVTGSGNLGGGSYSDQTYAGKVSFTNGGIFGISNNSRVRLQSGLALSLSASFDTGTGTFADCFGGVTLNMSNIGLDRGSTFELVSGDLVSTAAFASCYITGNGALMLDQSPTIIDTANGSAQNDVQISAPMVGAGGVVGADIVKQGAGSLLLSFMTNSLTTIGNNINSIQVRAGALQIGSDEAINGTKLTFSGGILTPIGASRNLNNAITITGPTTLDTSFGNDLTLSGTISGTGSITTTGIGKIVLATSTASLSGITVTDGTLEVAASAQPRVMRAGNFALSGSAKLNLQTNALITATAIGSWNGTTYTGVTGYVRAGRGNAAAPYWDGSSGIVTSQSNATTGNYTAIGIAKGAEVKATSTTATALWQGMTITSSDTLVMYTYGGDANLDGKLNVDDYIRIDFGDAAGLTGWANGDFNYDGKVNIDDYTNIIDSNIATQGAPFAAAIGGDGISVTAVPEPATFALTSLAVALTVRRRRSSYARSPSSKESC